MIADHQKAGPGTAVRGSVSLACWGNRGVGLEKGRMVLEIHGAWPATCRTWPFQLPVPLVHDAYLFVVPFAPSLVLSFVSVDAVPQ